VAEQPVAGDQAAVLPAVKDLPQGLLAELAGDLGEPGDNRPSSTRSTSERAAYCWPSQTSAATSRSVMPASVSQRARREVPAPSRPPWTCGPGRERPRR
jgi:hypothetical protein